jgi:hypothetical protein
VTARCDLTDLLPSDCAHCRKTPDPFAEPAVRRRENSEPGPQITARFAGKCGCGTGILPGDTIRADGQGGYLAACCDEDVAR